MRITDRVVAVAAALALALVSAACGPTRVETPPELRARGPTPYVRCASSALPEARRWQVGRLALSIEERALTITGAPADPLVAAFAGPAPGDGSVAQALGRLEARHPAFVLFLGGLGDDDATAARTASELAGSGLLVLAVAGGRDDYSRWQTSFAALAEPARDRVVDVSSFDRVVVGRHTLVPVAGAPGGRAATSADTCGISRGELDARARRLGGPASSEQRWLVSWWAPSAPGPASVALGLAGVDAGEHDVSELATRIGAPGGIFAYPREQALRPGAADGSRWHGANDARRGLRIVVSSLGGPTIERADGTRVQPGTALLRLSASGMSLESFVVAP